MKPINVNEKNADIITAALLAANGRAKSHTITRAWEIKDIADAATDYLFDLGLSKSRMTGVKMSFTSGAGVPAAYKWQRKVTWVTFERKFSGWFISRIEAIDLWGDAPKQTYLLTREQDAIVVAKFQSAYSVLEHTP